MPLTDDEEEEAACPSPTGLVYWRESVPRLPGPPVLHPPKQSDERRTETDGQTAEGLSEEWSGMPTLMESWKKNPDDAILGEKVLGIIVRGVQSASSIRVCPNAPVAERFGRQDCRAPRMRRRSSRKGGASLFPCCASGTRDCSSNKRKKPLRYIAKTPKLRLARAGPA